MATSTAFSKANCEKMPLIALVAKFNTLTDKAPRDETLGTAEVITKRLSTEKAPIADAIKFKLVDKLLQLSPHLFCRPLSDLVSEKSAAKTPTRRICVVVDVSGSMSSCIAQYQSNLKRWLAGRLPEYVGVSLIFFGSNVRGPYNDIGCLDQHQGSGKTYAHPALQILRHQLTIPSDVIFFTDGEFSDEKLAYTITTLPNVERFAMIFPEHTPTGAESEHFAYLPRITPPGIQITSQRCPGATSLGDTLDNCFVGSGTAAAIEKTLYTPIASEFAILTNVTIFQMHKIVETLLEYPEQDLVHNCFANIMGMFNAMLMRSGDLLNTLRCPEMRLMWTFLQPLKKRFTAVSPDHFHYATVVVVLDFLETFEGAIVDKRDSRLKELKQMSQTDAIKKEVEEIRKAFNNMKKVDDYDRIMTDIEKMKKQAIGPNGRSVTEDPNGTLPSVMRVKFHYTAACPLEQFCQYPNVSRDHALEIFKMVASVGTCSKTDPAGMDLIVRPDHGGLVTLLRLMPYRADHDVKMTLTATQVTRIIYGFFAHQILKGYEASHRHSRIRPMLWALAVQRPSFNILSNVTNTQEPVNTSGEWTSILRAIADHANYVVPESRAPVDKTLWVQSPSGYELNKQLLAAKCDIHTASHAIRLINNLGNDFRSVRVTSHIPISLSSFRDFILVQKATVQTWEQWADKVARVDTFPDHSTMPITNAMILQSRVRCDARAFIKRNWDKGNRLISRSGAAHPATTFGDNSVVRDAVEEWFRTAWAAIRGSLGLGSDNVFPVVPNAEKCDACVAALTAYAADHPVTYAKSNAVQVPIRLIINRLEDTLTPRVQYLARTEGFLDKTSEEQMALIEEFANLEPSLSVDVAEQPVEVVARVAEYYHRLHSKFGEMEVLNLAEGEKEASASASPKSAPSIESWLDSNETLASSIDKMTGDDLVVEDFTCPLSGDIFEDPVSFGGHIFERVWIDRWLITDRRRSSPLTRKTHGDDGKRLEIEKPPMVFLHALRRFKSVHGL